MGFESEICSPYLIVPITDKPRFFTRWVTFLYMPRFLQYTQSIINSAFLRVHAVYLPSFSTSATFHRTLVKQNYMLAWSNSQVSYNTISIGRLLTKTRTWKKGMKILMKLITKISPRTILICPSCNSHARSTSSQCLASWSCHSSRRILRWSD